MVKTLDVTTRALVALVATARAAPAAILAAPA
jgi:hypothetical protein